ncbi:hypothetical protein MTR67_023344 [Solanum verrucosum]|uniref:Integrase catalytic domain-containing protein n=1 Tax=Solanum verrucosum TaxID=315347 RepID=A0AAF0R1N9_SOLVR|nr:hypothetical protein MTR67_023344 [Solanum verrucosum]
MINMDFITGLPKSRRQHNSIWVIVDRMTKSAHFLRVKTTNTAEDYAKLYVQEIVRLHGVPISIISDRGAQFWKSFQKGLGSKVFNSLTERKIGEVTYYPEDPNCVDQQFEKLEFVELREFEGTIFEFIFLQQILAYSPSLSRMMVEPSDDLDVAEVLDLYEELMMSLKASPRVKVIVTPHGQDA